MSIKTFRAVMITLGVFANMAVFVDVSDARGGRGGGGRGMSRGGGMSAGMSRGGGVRSSGMSSINRGGSGYNRSSSFSRSSSYNRSAGGFDRSSSARAGAGAGARGGGGRDALGRQSAGAGVNRDLGRNGGLGDRNSGNRNLGDRNIGTGNIRGDTVNNIRGGNNNINIDNDGGWGGWNDHIHHPVAAGVALGTAAAVTAAAWGSVYYSVPTGCGSYYWGGYSYYNCGGYYLEPRYEGDTVVYVTVPDPSGDDTATTAPAN